MDPIDTTVLCVTTRPAEIETGRERLTNRLEQFEGADGSLGIF